MLAANDRSVRCCRSRSGRRRRTPRARPSGAHRGRRESQPSTCQRRLSPDSQSTSPPTRSPQPLSEADESDRSFPAGGQSPISLRTRVAASSIDSPLVSMHQSAKVLRSSALASSTASSCGANDPRCRRSRARSSSGSARNRPTTMCGPPSVLTSGPRSASTTPDTIRVRAPDAAKFARSAATFRAFNVCRSGSSVSGG